MAFVLDRDGRVRAACRNPLTLVGRDICASHIYEVWDHIPRYIVDELEKDLGLRIPGLLTVGLKVIRNGSYPQMITYDKRLHMVIADEVASTYALRSNRPLYTLAPNTNLNLAKLCHDLNMPRYAVDACINEVVHAFKQAIVTFKKVQFIFEGMGCLTIDNGRVTDCFDPSFMRTFGFGRRIVAYKTRFPCICERVCSNDRAQNNSNTGISVRNKEKKEGTPQKKNSTKRPSK